MHFCTKVLCCNKKLAIMCKNVHCDLLQLAEYIANGVFSIDLHVHAITLLEAVVTRKVHNIPTGNSQLRCLACMQLCITEGSTGDQHCISKPRVHKM